jgi:cation diffusion facilitator family transporter
VAGSSTKAILYAFGANLGIAISKFVAWGFTSSGSMLAEAIHSSADCINQIFLFVGLNRSNRPPTAEHPLGFGKAIYVWSFFVAIMLFSIGGVFSIYEGIHKLHPPEGAEELANPLVALGVLAVSILLEASSLFGALREIKKLSLGKGVKQWIKTTRNAELVVVLGEDIAALFGLVLAFVFVLLAMVTGNSIFDAIGSICIGAMLIIISFWLVFRIQALLIGRSADPDLQESIKNCINEDGNITEVLNVLTCQFGSQVMLAVKIRMKSGIDIETAARAINELEKKIKSSHPEVAWSFVEPDVAD